MVMTAGKEGGGGDNGVVEFQFYSPDNKTKWETFKTAIYDKSSNQILGRTPKNWGQLLIFYSIFYTVLAALFALCMQGLFASLDDMAPTRQLEDSLIGINPGLGFRPISDDTNEGSLIWYNITNQTTIDRWVKLVDKFLDPYQKDRTGDNFVNCDYNKLPGEGKVCVIDIDQFKQCTRNNSYGYNTASPCIFLKLNRIFNWKPEYFTNFTKEMPDELKNYIAKASTEERNQVWVTCNGIEDFDKENIGGFNYYPHGFAGYYYPYINLKNYLSPIVAVQIQDITPNVVVNIECRAWAKNIVYRGGTLNRAGSVTFEIQIDSEYKPSKPKEVVTTTSKPKKVVTTTSKPKEVVTTTSKPNESTTIVNI